VTPDAAILSPVDDAPSPLPPLPKVLEEPPMTPTSTADADGPPLTIAAAVNQQLSSSAGAVHADNDGTEAFDRSFGKSVSVECTPWRGAAATDKTACSKACDAATPMLSSNDKLQPSNHPADDPAAPTRFVFRTLSPRTIRCEDSCRTTASTPTPCKMYRRRARSDAAQQYAGAALPPPATPSSRADRSLARAEPSTPAEMEPPPTVELKIHFTDHRS
jgi:hypothetical protein